MASHLPDQQRGTSPPRHRSGPSEGELFVPIKFLPHEIAGNVVLSVRVRGLEGRLGAHPRLMVEFRFGPLVAGMKVDKAASLSVKGQMELVRQADGTWIPDRSVGGTVRVPLPPMLLQQEGQGVACRLKVTTPGFVSANVLATSAPLPVPLMPQAVPLVEPKVSNSGAPVIGAPHIARVMLSIGCVFPVDVQTSMSKSLMQQLMLLLEEPAATVDSLSQGGSDAAAQILDALRPTRGWLAATGIPQALGIPDDRGKSSLRRAVDGHHWECVKILSEVGCDIHKLSEDLRSPFTAGLERDTSALQDLLVSSRLGPEQRRMASELAKLLARCSSGGTGSLEVQREWDSLAQQFAIHCGPRSRSGSSAADWSCDLYALTLEKCPTAKGRRDLLTAEGACASLWQASLTQNLPDLARKIAVWIGLSLHNTLPETPSDPSRRQLLDMALALDGRAPGVVQALALERALALSDERWMTAASAMIRLGASGNAPFADGRPVILFALEQADKGHKAFEEFAKLLLDRLGSVVDHWTQPMVLRDQDAVECPICMEDALWTSTPTTFVEYRSEGLPHVKCGHFVCFNCAGMSFERQQRQNVDQFFCPICRETARDVYMLPDIATNPRLWFQFFDREGKGRMDKQIVVQALEATLPLETESLRQAMDDHCWATWDKSDDGCITESSFFAPDGLLEWIRGHQHQLQLAKNRGKAPDLADARAWFRHWDRTKKGRLLKGEALRGLCEAAQVSSLEHRKVQRLHEAVEAAFAQYVTVVSTPTPMSTARTAHTSRTALSDFGIYHHSSAISIEAFLRLRVAEDFSNAIKSLSSDDAIGTKATNALGIDSAFGLEC